MTLERLARANEKLNETDKALRAIIDKTGDKLEEIHCRVECTFHIKYASAPAFAMCWSRYHGKWQLMIVQGSLQQRLVDCSRNVKTAAVFHMETFLDRLAEKTEQALADAERALNGQ